MTPQPTLERVWYAYLLAVAVVGLAAGGDHVPRADLAAHLALHGGVLAVVVVVHTIAVRRSAAAARPWRVALGIAGLPVVFSAMSWLLPHVHPEPYEYRWLELDRRWFGGDLGDVVAPWLPAWSVELLQLVYAGFYAVPILAGIGAGRGRGAAAFDRAMLALVSGFLASYLGYLLVPTLGPKVVLPFATAVEGLWATAPLRAWIDAAEANPWDCFPSGHTMLTVLSLCLLWRWHRPWFWRLLPPALLLIASTMLLRYHWAIDVLVGAAVAWPWLRLCDWLADRDHWPRVTAAGSAVRPATAAADRC
ncbi:MAG: phosphatase PAP2 family protein [Planctomycetes bacterium]|nr:phosphatase PAP2 family protein [Planctomycetota bacterium]